MKQNNIRIAFSLCLASLLLMAGCRKEKAPAPSDLDKNYFVIEDNPNDPIDHAIYEFYKSTGFAAYYNDTIYKKKISRENENPPRYSYITLSLNYAPLGNVYNYYLPLSSREGIPALLSLLETEMLPKLPPNRLFPSILFIDSFRVHSITDVQVSHGWSSLPGFNTLGIVMRDVEAMNSAERKTYTASILAGIAAKRINELMATRVQKEFLSISREVTKNIFPFEIDIYYGVPFMLLLPPGSEPLPKDIGFLFYPTFDLSGMLLPSMLREEDDIRAYLAAVFNYSEQEFAEMHPGETLVLKKFGIMKNFAAEAGFKFPG